MFNSSNVPNVDDDLRRVLAGPNLTGLYVRGYCNNPGLPVALVNAPRRVVSDSRRVSSGAEIAAAR